MYAAIEAILFSMGVAVESSHIAAALEIDEDEAERCILELMQEYEKDHYGIRIIRLENRFQMCTKPELYPFVQKFNPDVTRGGLTGVQLEVLTIAAYKQPVTKAEIDQIRGADSYAVLAKLIEMDLLEEKGRLGRPGSPILYGTTQRFLRSFGLTSIDTLPVLEYEKRLDMEIEAEQEITDLMMKK